jgi:hypothetical protein
MASAGISVTNSCPSAVRFATPPPPPAVSERQSPVNALPPRGASACAKGGSGTRCSLSASGGMSAGFHFANTIT